MFKLADLSLFSCFCFFPAEVHPTDCAFLSEPSLFRAPKWVLTAQSSVVHIWVPPTQHFTAQNSGGVMELDCILKFHRQRRLLCCTSAVVFQLLRDKPPYDTVSSSEMSHHSMIMMKSAPRRWASIMMPSHLRLLLDHEGPQRMIYFPSDASGY